MSSVGNTDAILVHDLAIKSAHISQNRDEQAIKGDFWIPIIPKIPYNIPFLMGLGTNCWILPLYGYYLPFINQNKKTVQIRKQLQLVVFAIYKGISGRSEFVNNPLSLELNISEFILEGRESQKHLGDDYENNNSLLRDKGSNVKKRYV